ncbi:MAG: glycosyltransferase [Candidatus Pacebacteria bacterium]|nr:glycosyltransferase [Candidatus Paceibacterota bacterium]
MNILINGLTIEEGNIVPLLRKIKFWQKQENTIAILGNEKLKRKIGELRIINSNYTFIKVQNTKNIKTKQDLIFEGLKRNIKILRTARGYGNFNVVYTISSVLDLIIFPFFLKRANKKIKWATVFDNVVPLNDPGNKIIRFLAWTFFHISLVLLKKADCIFVISEDLKRYLIKKGFDKEKIILTGNAVEANLIKKAKRNKKYNIDALFVGRINETKGIYDMLEVLEIVRKKYPNFQLAIMGRGDDLTEEKYKNEIKRRNLEKNVKFLGYKTGLEKFNIFKSSKCFLFLSESESFGIALLEAVCCGLPAFVYNLSPYKHIYKNNEVIISKKHDYKSVAEKVIQLFENKNFENKKGKLLVNKYSWDKIAKIELSSLRALVS